jgi:hypothetical protein
MPRAVLEMWEIFGTRFAQPRAWQSSPLSATPTHEQARRCSSFEAEVEREKFARQLQQRAHWRDPVPSKGDDDFIWGGLYRPKYY